MKLLLLIMAIASERVVADSDPAFTRVDTRTPAHLLPATVAADATNKRFDDKRARPRNNINQGPWGLVGRNVAPTVWNGAVASGYVLQSVTLVPGRTYYYEQGNSIELSTAATPANPVVTIIPPGSFVATVNSYLLVANAALSGEPISARILVRGFSQVAYHRFNDPDGFDVTVVATDDWRDGSGEDGGRGRVWKILANNLPVEVPLNGHDIWDTTRFVPCRNSLVLLRQGNERHYFQAAAVGAPAANQIQLNCQPAWQNGDSVFLWGDASKASAFTGTSAPSSGSFCFVKNLANNVVELYADANLTQLLAYTEATGRFYLERRASQPGPYGNGAPPLIAQPTAAGATVWESGFAAVPVTLDVTDTDSTTGIWTVPNHRLQAADQVTLANMPGGHTPADGDYYAVPLNDHQLLLFDTQVNAQLRVADPTSTTGLEAISNSGETAPTLTKKGASGLPMPPATEGMCAQNNRLVLVNGNALFISDPYDWLHFTPMEASINANLGEADTVTGVAQLLSADALIIAKQKSILALYNFSGGPTAWALKEVTREYGCLSALTLCPWGNRLMFLSRRGLDSVVVTLYGTVLPQQHPVSYDLKRYVDRIDWNQAAKSCVETWTDRLFWAVPLKSGAKTTGNTAVLTLNFTNSDVLKVMTSWEDTTHTVYAWEGQWTGPSLNVAGWARHTIAGEERLTFVDPNGQVFWLGDGSLDTGNVPISDSLTTRLYTGVREASQLMARKVFNRLNCVWDTHDAQLTVTAVTPGYQEQTVVTPAGGLTYDAAAYDAGTNLTYNAATQTPPFATPFRGDYTLQNVTELIGGQPDVLQNHAEPFNLREADWAVQFIIANSRGVCVLQSVSVSGFLGPSSNRSLV